MARKSPPSHWLPNNWIFLTLGAVIFFATANLLIGEIANIGMVGITYFCSGSLLVTICYFIYTGELKKRNVLLDRNKENCHKVLTRTWDNKFDWFAILFCTFGAICQTCIYASIMFCYKLSHQAGLNIGISQAIWAINPFLIAFMELIFFRVGLK